MSGASRICRMDFSITRFRHVSGLAMHQRGRGGSDRGTNRRWKSLLVSCSTFNVTKAPTMDARPSTERLFDFFIDLLISVVKSVSSPENTVTPFMLSRDQLRSSWTCSYELNGVNTPNVFENNISSIIEIMLSMPSLYVWYKII